MCPNNSFNLIIPLSRLLQIKYLLVQYIYAGDKSSTHIDILPFTGFISDLHLVNEIEDKNSKYTYENESNYHDLLVNKDKYLALFSEEAYNSMLKTSLEIEQRKFGDTISINSDFIRTCFPKKSRFYKYFESIHQNWTEALLRTPIKLKLPGLPKNGSENKEISNNYKEKIRNELVQYIEKIFFLEGATKSYYYFCNLSAS